jgi:hypothetical protein
VFDVKDYVRQAQRWSKQVKDEYLEDVFVSFQWTYKAKKNWSHEIYFSLTCLRSLVVCQ